MTCGIYKIENLLNHKVYIGQSINIQFRIQKHKGLKDNCYIHRAIQKYGKENFSYEIIEECEQYNLNEREKYWINQYNSLIPNGYNMIPGGSNGAGLSKGIPVEQYSLDGIYIQTFSSALQASKELNISHSNISSCCNGHRKQAGFFQWKKQNSDKEIQSIEGQFHHDIILKYDLDGNFIEEYISLQEASEKNNISKARICLACKGKAKTAANFQWKYKHSNKEIKKLNKQVEQYTLDQKLVNVFQNCSKAHKQTGIHLGNINQCCKGKRKTAGGYKWKYK